MKLISLVLALAPLPLSALAQDTARTPSETALRFYEALREKRWVEGFSLSVYGEAVAGLTADELKSLEPDFARAFPVGRTKIEALGEEVKGDTATVTLKIEGRAEPLPVALSQVEGEWLVGDSSALALVGALGRSYFFNARMPLNQAKTAEILRRILEGEEAYAKANQGRRTSLLELVMSRRVPTDLQDGEAAGYRFRLSMSQNQRAFSVTATPVEYGRTGRLSFYADKDGIRAEEREGKPATAKAPLYRPPQ